MKKTILALSLFLSLSLCSCGNAENSSSTSLQQSTAETTEAESTAADTTEAAEETTAEAATEHETAPQNEVGYEGMEEVSADAVNDGEYHISVDSSSSMFKIADCILHAENGCLTADIIIDSKSYDALFMGTEEEADSSAESDRITYTENENGQSVFTVPVEALDKEIQCAALSAKKQEWYGRTLVFRADSLPDDAFSESRYVTAGELSLEDGQYNIEVTLEGGSGRASVESPAILTIENGSASAKIIWSSDKYDQMIVNGETFTPEIADGHSVFDIPVIGFDYKMPVQAETTAMSEPHMIDYTLYFDSSTAAECE